MKRALLLLAVLMLIGCSTHEQASMTIRAVGPTGDTFYRPPQPIWRFAITNTGASQLIWSSSVEVRNTIDGDYSRAGGHIDWPEAVVAPGESLITEMIVPAKAGAVWRASVEFWRISTQDLKRAQVDAERFGSSVVEFCPRHPDGKRKYNDAWHP